jgi:hypothetical protein
MHSNALPPAPKTVLSSPADSLIPLNLKPLTRPTAVVQLLSLNTSADDVTTIPSPSPDFALHILAPLCAPAAAPCVSGVPCTTAADCAAAAAAAAITYPPICDERQCVAPAQDPAAAPRPWPAPGFGGWAFQPPPPPPPPALVPATYVSLVLAASAAAAAEGFVVLAAAYAPAAVCPTGSVGVKTTLNVLAGPVPFQDLRSAPSWVIVGDFAAAAQLVAPVILVNTTVHCRNCTPGTIAPALATACVACSPGTLSTRPTVPCSACPRGTYQPAAGAVACLDCPTETPRTLAVGAAAAAVCFGASVSVERAWVAGQQLAIVVTWNLEPAAAAGVGDIVAIFKEHSGGVGKGLPRREVSWAYTSSTDSPVAPPSIALHLSLVHRRYTCINGRCRGRKPRPSAAQHGGRHRPQPVHLP